MCLVYGVPSTERGLQKFDLFCGPEKSAEIALRVPGRFNIYNALAAAACAWELGALPEDIKGALEGFRGTWRRFEILGQCGGATVVSDYAHHPTAVRKTLEAAREFYPGKRITAVFQPHQRNRTRKLLSEFARSFGSADIVILPEIFDVAGRENQEDADISSADLAEKIAAIRGGETAVSYAGSLEKAEKMLMENVGPGDVVLIMGAGDAYKLAEKICG